MDQLVKAGERRSYKKLTRALKREAKKLGVPYEVLKNDMFSGKAGLRSLMRTGGVKLYHKLKKED